jgi:hypothetical protein
MAVSTDKGLEVEDEIKHNESTHALEVDKEEAIAQLMGYIRDENGLDMDG